MVVILALLLLVFAAPTKADVINASTASASDVQTAIDSASNGDTVLLPSSATATWTSSVSLGSSKYITLDLNGSTITVSGSGITFSVDAHATGNNRVTNGALIRGSGYDPYNGPIAFNDSRGSAGIIIDNIDFTGSNVIVNIAGQGPGVMYNCTFSGISGAQEFVHINGWGPSSTTGWTNDSGDSLAGSGEVFTIEDSTFTMASSLAFTGWIQGYYGARARFRHNIFDAVSIDMHGTAGNIGARWWEIYDNTWQNTVNNTAGVYMANMRAGSGVIYSNNDTDGAIIGLCEEDSGYPALYQIGRGLDQALDPARVWDTDADTSVGLNSCDAPEQPNMVQLDRDVYYSERPSYTEYTYPHPLRSGATETFTHHAQGISPW